MKKGFAAISLAAGVYAFTFGGSWAAPAVFLDNSAFCGTTADKHVCIKLTQAEHDNKVVILRSKSLGATKGSWLVIWSGSVTCKINAKTIQVDHHEADVQLHLQLNSGQEGIEIGGEGGATVGFLVTQPDNFIHSETTPVTLTRLFETSIQNLVVVGKPVFKRDQVVPAS